MKKELEELKTVLIKDLIGPICIPILDFLTKCINKITDMINNHYKK